MAVSPGTRLGPYEIVGRIGAGGMGEVYKATDTRLGRLVAIKFLDPVHAERFQREARAIASLNHPHICTLHDVGPDYLVMEFIEGEPVKGPLPLDRAITIGADIADALDAAHRKGIVHRDLKPANILLTKQGIKVSSSAMIRLLLRSLITSFGVARDRGIRSSGASLSLHWPAAFPFFAGLNCCRRAD